MAISYRCNYSNQYLLTQNKREKFYSRQILNSSTYPLNRTRDQKDASSVNRENFSVENGCSFYDATDVNYGFLTSQKTTDVHPRNEAVCPAVRNRPGERTPTFTKKERSVPSRFPWKLIRRAYRRRQER